MITPTSGTWYQTYINAIENGNATHVKIEFENGGGTLTDDDISIEGGVVVSSTINPDEDISFGYAVSTEVKIYCLNNSNVQSVVWEEPFALSFGVELNGSIDWVCIGYFKGKRPDMDFFSTVSSIIEFTAYDFMQDFEVIADSYLQSLANTFPTDSKTLASNLCALVNNSTLDTTKGYSTPISSNIFPSGLTCRQVLSLLAEASGGSIKMKGGTKNFELFQYDKTGIQPNINFFLNSLYVLKISSVISEELNTIQFMDTSDSSNDYTYTMYGGIPKGIYKIIDNPIIKNLSSANKATVAQNLVQIAYDNFRFTRTVHAECVGNWLIEVGDPVAIAYAKNGQITTGIVTYVFSKTMTWNGALHCTLDSTANLHRKNLTQSEQEKYAEGGKLAEKANNDEVVHTTGDEEIGGAKTFTSDITIQERAANQYILFRKHSGTNGVAGRIRMQHGATANQANNQMWFYEYSPTNPVSADSTGFAERYKLPAPDAGLEETVDYKIVTQKDGMRFRTLSTSVTSVTVDIPIGRSSLIFTAGPSTNSMGMWLVFGRSGNTTVIKAISTASNITITPGSDGKITVEFTASSGMAVVSFYGLFPD
ncbi:MAG: hypothetical protein J6Y60_03530 [Treponema sp.]|nr:hypothetical protein [Treponema sp.]